MDSAAFVFENVPALTWPSNRGHLHRIVTDLRSVGYGVATGIVDARDFGIPQMRRRLFIVGLRGWDDFSTNAFFETLNTLRTTDRDDPVVVADVIDVDPPDAEWYRWPWDESPHGGES